MTSSPLDKKHIPFWVESVLDYGRAGDSIEIFFKYQNVRKSEWDAYANKHKKIRVAMMDAEAFARGVVKDSIHRLMYEKGLNQTVAKLFLDNMTGWGGNIERIGTEPPVVNIVLGRCGNKKDGPIDVEDLKTNVGANSELLEDPEESTEESRMDCEIKKEVKPKGGKCEIKQLF